MPWGVTPSVCQLLHLQMALVLLANTPFRGPEPGECEVPGPVGCGVLGRGGPLPDLGGTFRKAWEAGGWMVRPEGHGGCLPWWGLGEPGLGLGGAGVQLVSKLTGYSPRPQFPHQCRRE